ncbi:MAG: hypothetical protein MNPFHGCM_02526 [Gemmatimonadaceae bacterium]|nr:hypothetical protein [Gemmatimonadaceae bacterium]
MSFLRSIFPETLFPRRLDEASERRLKLAQARAEEALVETHVQNALLFVDALADEMSFDRAIDAYIRVMNVPEPLASTVATRVLVVLGQDLMPQRDSAASEDGRPAIRIRRDDTP